VYVIINDVGCVEENTRQVILIKEMFLDVNKYLFLLNHKNSNFEILKKKVLDFKIVHTLCKGSKIFFVIFIFIIFSTILDGHYEKYI